MNYKHYSFRHAVVIFQEAQFKTQYDEIIEVIESISDKDLIDKHTGFGAKVITETPMSLSKSINHILKERFVAKGWIDESAIFKDGRYKGDNWRLDFAKDDVSIEVAFNHQGSIAWNLLKPVLASELNHVNKAIQTKIGVVITATNDLRKLGGFDSAIGTFEKFLQYLPILNNVLTVPLLIIGLEPPETFTLKKHQQEARKKIGNIEMIKLTKPLPTPDRSELEF